ncbi:MAG: hypothetical protein WC515_06545 [Candidatus Omnitrophota bacterium]
MDTHTLLISLLVAITTAFITALLNNYYWKRQLKDAERSEYRKFYHKRKLETYETLLYKAMDTRETVHEFVFALNKDIKAVQPAKLSEKFIDILNYLLQRSLYISSDILRITKPLFRKTPDNVAKDPNGFFDEYHAGIAALADGMRQELGIQELLHGKEMEDILHARRLLKTEIKPL